MLHKLLTFRSMKSMDERTMMFVALASNDKIEGFVVFLPIMASFLFLWESRVAVSD